MASPSPSPSPSLLVLIIACSLISPAISQTTCSKQNLNSVKFDTCMDLPSLDSQLHYTYDASNSSLAVAFVATPSRSDGWVAWGINPTLTGMSGTQAFLAYESGAGAPPVVKTYNISGYALIPGRLAFEFWNLRAESIRDGKIAIFTTVKVPAGARQVNQVWQIGGNVTNGTPFVHPFTPENLSSKRVLSLSSGTPNSPPSSGSGGSTTPRNGGSLTTNVKFGVNLGILVLLGSIFIF